MIATANAIAVHGLWKRYGPVEAVRGIDLEVRPGEIFGLIGPDGAGKTTTFQILAGVMEATSGSADIFGRAGPRRAFANRLSHPELQSLPRPHRGREHPLHRRSAARFRRRKSTGAESNICTCSTWTASPNVWPDVSAAA